MQKGRVQRQCASYVGKASLMREGRKSHLYTWHKSEHNGLFAAPDPHPKEQPMVTDFMWPTCVEKLAVNSDHAKKLTTAMAEFIARYLRPISVIDGTGFLNLI